MPKKSKSRHCKISHSLYEHATLLSKTVITMDFVIIVQQDLKKLSKTACV